jgi:hypothetical protein
VNRNEILIIRYCSTTVVTICQHQGASPIVSSETNNDWIQPEDQPEQKPRLTFLQTKTLAGWASQLINRLFGR